MEKQIFVAESAGGNYNERQENAKNVEKMWARGKLTVQGIGQEGGEICDSEKFWVS
ncbi:MAG: hypothetical protein UEE32_02755 [Oscillospiraceae bacterium]|nr:hypothetical protein [Oscillospiraceae bacterium]